MVTYKDPTNAERTVNLELASAPEYRRLRTLAKQASKFNHPPFVAVRENHRETLAGWRELLAHVKNEGTREVTIQRYKGLGEMNAEQLWETTLDPNARSLLQVRVNDATDADGLFARLMGDEVEPRRVFIQDNSAEPDVVARILALLTFRPEFTPPWGARSHVAHVTLTRLPQQQTETMIARLTQGKALPAEVHRQLVLKTDGVPLFVEELTKMVLESGLLSEREERYEQQLSAYNNQQKEIAALQQFLSRVAFFVIGRPGLCYAEYTVSCGEGS
jgi:hypothetical protein